MKTTLLLTILLVTLLTGCSAVYRTGQTPDDVYFSPARPETEYVQVQRQQTRRVRYEAEDYEDRFLRMRINNPARWNYLDDWYTFERWSIGYNQFFSPVVNPFVSWNYYYNPYFSSAGWAQAPVKNIFTGPRIYNLGSYQQAPVDLKLLKQNTSTRSNYIPFGTGKGSGSGNRGNALREAFGVGNSGGVSGGSPVSSPVNSNPSNSSSGSSAPVRRF